MGRKAEHRKKFDGSIALFNHCWKQILWMEAANGEMGEMEIELALDGLASEAVNDCDSRFYMYG